MIAFLNGIISLVDCGLSECISGFGESEDICSPEYSDNFGKLEYWPSDSNNPAKVVNELSLLLTGGRLNSRSQNIIAQAFQGQQYESDGLRLAQKLISTTPEFHSTSVFDATSTNRPEVENPNPSNERYKAVSRLINVDNFHVSIFSHTLTTVHRLFL